MNRFKNAIGVVKACGLNIKGSKKLMEEVKQIERTIIQALEKQVPKKVIKHGFDPNKQISSVSYTCPTCHSHISKTAHCSNCSQALDWSDTE